MWKELKPTLVVGGGSGEEKAVLELSADPDSHDMGATAPSGFRDLGQRLLRGP